jgi:hypothetical protein
MVKDRRVFEGKREIRAKLDRGIHDVDNVDDGHDQGRSDGGGRSDCDDRNSGGHGAVRRGVCWSDCHLVRVWLRTRSPRDSARESSIQFQITDLHYKARMHSKYRQAWVYVRGQPEVFRQ